MTIPPVSSVYGRLALSAQLWPDRPLLNVLPSTSEVYGIPSGELLYADVLDEVDRLADQYVNAGYGVGMRVAVLLENRPAYFLHWIALNKIGASIVPVNPDLRSAELEYLIGHSEPALVIALPARAKELELAAKTAGVELSVAHPDDTPPTPRPNAKVATITENDEDRETAVLYTSGTTGQPKGCILSNIYFLLAGSWYTQQGGIATLSEDGERMITPLPVFHMNAMACSFMAMLQIGGCLTVLDRFHPSSWWQDVRDSQATCLHYLGVMPSILMGADPSSQDRNHNIRFGFGAGIDPKLQARFEERFGFPIVEAWAMTETGSGAVIAANTTDRLVGQACLGRPEHDVETCLVDEDGEVVPAGVPGELLVRRSGDNPRFGFFSAYYKNPEATDEAWENGWFHTGDIVRQDADGNMFFVDRKKNVIRRSGENIAALEVESILMRHPEIEAAGVAAVPDEIRGDEVFACLKVAEPSSTLAQDITRWCLDQMAYYKAPGYVAFVDELPLTATQKIQRAELKKRSLGLLKHPETVNTTSLKKRQSV